jgi:hypothetical protein
LASALVTFDKERQPFAVGEGVGDFLGQLISAASARTGQDGFRLFRPKAGQH